MFEFVGTKLFYANSNWFVNIFLKVQKGAICAIRKINILKKQLQFSLAIRGGYVLDKSQAVNTKTADFGYVEKNSFPW